NEAEKIYLGLVKQTDEDPDGFSKLELYDLRFGLAILYAEKGELQKHLEATKSLPGGLGKQADEDVREYGGRMVMLETAAANFCLAQKNLNAAEKTARNAVRRSQLYFGAASLEHADAVELLSNVRVAQSNYGEAVDLLKKSADIRAGLL